MSSGYGFSKTAAQLLKKTHTSKRSYTVLSSQLAWADVQAFSRSPRQQLLKVTPISQQVLVPYVSKRTISLPGFGKTKKDYCERRLLGYSMQQMYQVVAEVEHYKNFVPYCMSSVVTSRSLNHLKANIVVGFPPLTESYISNVQLSPPNIIKAMSTEGKMFNHMLTVWKFSPGLKDNAKTCTLDFAISFEFKNALHSQLSHMFFDQIVKQMVNAFLREAKRRHGVASIGNQRPQIVSST